MTMKYSLYFKKLELYQNLLDKFHSFFMYKEQCIQTFNWSLFRWLFIRELNKKDGTIFNLNIGSSVEHTGHGSCVM